MRWSRGNWFRSLRGRLIAAYLVGLAVTVAVISGIFLLVFGMPDNPAMRQHRLQEAAHKITHRLERAADGTPLRIVLGGDLQWIYGAFAQDVEFRVVDAQGQVVLRVHPRQQLLPLDFHLRPEVGTLQRPVNGVQVFIATVQVKNTPPGRTYYLQAAASERLITLAYAAADDPVRGSLTLALLVSIPVLIGLMLLALNSLLRPLRETSEAAAHIDPRNLSARLPVSHVPTELVPLISAFNQVLERLEHGFRVQQQFLGAAAHELKTPLTLMRSQIELDGTADKATLLMDIDVMARQVHQLLHLAEVSEAHNYQMDSFAPVDVAVEAVGFLSRLADRHQVQLDLQLPAQAVHWQGDKSALFTLLKNLLENAIQHSAAGDVVTLALDPLGLGVRDAGPGITAAHRPHLFERFWRGPRPEAMPQGAGLGLSICQEIALAHGWQLRLYDTSSGCLFRLDIGHPPSSINP